MRLELQADCLAGVWANQAQRRAKVLEPGDLEEGLRAASAIGDDQMQRRAQGYTVPESWTHGSSEMRVHWLRRGLQSGNVAGLRHLRQADSEVGARLRRMATRVSARRAARAGERCSA